MAHPKDQVTCGVCKRTFPHHLCSAASALRPTLVERIRKQVPDLPDSGFICQEDLTRIRGEMVTEMLDAKQGDMSRMEDQVLASIHREEILARKLKREERAKSTFGNRTADRLARLGGSWTFLIGFGAFVVTWMAVNALTFMALGRQAFDPYPFILLNLILSCLASVQAPVILMNQSRQEARDRKRAQDDYQVNLKAELEIRSLHDKMDHMLDHQWRYLMEIQRIQMEMMEEIARRKT